jgi:hypothetical protein
LESAIHQAEVEHEQQLRLVQAQEEQLRILSAHVIALQETLAVVQNSPLVRVLRSLGAFRGIDEMLARAFAESSNTAATSRDAGSGDVKP